MLMGIASVADDAVVVDVDGVVAVGFDVVVADDAVVGW